ncbi:unnamed protein product [Scytosiphon promiscuus]
MTSRASDVKRTRAAQVPYTPPAARRSSRPPPDHAEGYTPEAAPRARQPQGKTSPCQRRTAPGGGAAHQRPAGNPKVSPAKMDKVSSSSSSNKPPVPASTQTATAVQPEEPAAAAAAAATAAVATEESRPKEERRGDNLSSSPRGSSTSQTPGHPAPSALDRKNAPQAATGAASRRKPRQAWAQYVPPSRRGSATPSSEVARPSSSSVASGSKNGAAHSAPADADPGASAAVRDPRGVGGVSPSRPVKSRPAPKEKSATPPRGKNEVALEKPAVVDEGEPVADCKMAGGGMTEPGGEAAILLPSSDAEVEGDTSNATILPTTPRDSQATPPFPVEISDGGLSGGTDPESTALQRPDVPSEKQEDVSPAPPAPASASATSPDAAGVDSPREGPTGNGNDQAGKGGAANGAAPDEAPQLPVLKPPSARYIPPGRRKALDTEAAAAAGRDSNGGGGGASADGIGPLWASRTPVRVSQRERASDRESETVARPSPSRVAGVVSGGMSAYGANISEYSEEMSREQVEACTAVVSNFPAALPPGQRDPMLQSFVALGGLVVWPRPDEALVTFATPALARQAVSARNNRSSVLLVELLSQTRGEKRAAYRRVELARPGRPPADVSSGSRLILGALGIRRAKPKPSGAAATTRKTSTGGVRGRGAKNAQAPPAESTDSWDM